MNDREVSRIKSEHEYTKKYVTSPTCPVCHYPMEATTINRYVDLLDQHGGVWWGENQDIPVWKCQKGHIVHFNLMGGK